MHLSPFHSLHASAYRAGNHIASDHVAVHVDNTVARDVLVLTRDDYDWTNWAGQIRHSWLIGARSVGTIQAQGGWHRSRYAYFGLREQTERLETPEAVDEAVAMFQPELGATVGSNE